MVYAVPARTIATTLSSQSRGRALDGDCLARLLTSDVHICVIGHQSPRQNPIGKVGPGPEAVQYSVANRLK